MLSVFCFGVLNKVSLHAPKNRLNTNLEHKVECPTQVHRVSATSTQTEHAHKSGCAVVLAMLVARQNDPAEAGGAGRVRVPGRAVR